MEEYLEYITPEEIELYVAELEWDDTYWYEQWVAKQRKNKLSKIK